MSFCFIYSVVLENHSVQNSPRGEGVYKQLTIYTICSLAAKLYYIQTSTKNASLIITYFLTMIYKTEQPHTASLCRGWAMLENDFNLIRRSRYSDDVIQARRTHDGIVHRSLMISIWICTQFVPLMFF